MSSNPLVSVVLPSFNHEKYVASAIESVLNQTYQNIEVLISDDGSTDRSFEIAKQYEGDKRIVEIMKHEKNIGPVNNLNYLIKKARGEYICLLNTDDIFYLSKIEKQVQFLQVNNDLAAVFSFAQAIDDDGKIITPNNPHFEPRHIDISKNVLLRTLFLHGNVLIHPSIMIRRDVYSKIGLYDNRFFQIPDLLKWVDLIDKHQVQIYPEKLIKFRFRSHNKNASSGKRQDVVNRTFFEYTYFVDKYMKMAKAGVDFLLILPQIGQYSNEIPQDVRFAMFICESDHFTKMQGLGNVYRLIAKRIIYDYLHQDTLPRVVESNDWNKYLFDLGGNHLIFNTSSDSTLMEQNQLLSEEIDAITQSVSWKLLFILRVYILDKIFPRRIIYIHKIKPVVKKIYFKLSNVFKSLLNIVKWRTGRLRKSIIYFETPLTKDETTLVSFVIDNVTPFDSHTDKNSFSFTHSVVSGTQFNSHKLSSKYLCFSKIKEISPYIMEKMLFLCENFKYDMIIAIEDYSLDLEHEGTVLELLSNDVEYRCVIVIRSSAIFSTYIKKTILKSYWVKHFVSQALNSNLKMKAIKYAM